jgi:hypothetical protein
LTALIPGGHRQVNWRLSCVKRRCKHNHDGVTVGELGRDSDRHDGEYRIWLEQKLPYARYCTSASNERCVLEPVPASKTSPAASTCIGLRVGAQSSPEIVDTARVYFDDPVDRRLASLTAMAPKSAAAHSERRPITAGSSSYAWAVSSSNVVA